MTKEQLEQVNDLRNEIEQLEREIENIKKSEKQDVVTGSMTEHPYIQHSIVINGHSDASNCETKPKELRLIQKTLKLNRVLGEVDQWVQTINNSRIRQIITYKYYDGLTWDAVAAKMGYRYSAEGCRKACRRFLGKN